MIEINNVFILYNIANRMDKAEFLKLKHMVLEEFNNLENIINITICYKYFKEVNRGFMFPVLHSSYFSFALRVDILSKILPNFSEDIKGKLNRMGKFRNIFAHISPIYFDNGEKMTFDKVGWFPNPDKLDEKLDFEKTHKEFFELRDKVLPYIVEQARSVGAPFSDKNPA